MLGEKKAAGECSQTANNIPCLDYLHSDQEIDVEKNDLCTYTEKMEGILVDLGKQLGHLKECVTQMRFAR